jgi:hypothetical protein
MSGIITLALAASGSGAICGVLRWIGAPRRVRIPALLTAAGILGYFLNQLGEHFPRGG